MANSIEFNLADKSFMVLAKDENGRTVGSAVASLEEKSRLSLCLIEVDRVRRGLGFGKELLHEVMAVGIRCGARWLTGIFIPEPGYERQARAFYQRMGVKITNDGKLFRRLV